MAVPIASTNTRADDLVPFTSRYNEGTVILYGEAKKLTFTTYKRAIINEQAEDRVAVIPPGMEYRPDLVSTQAYGTPDFWWKIMEANRINDIFDFKAGKTIRIPEAIFE